ncbi:cationic amino acid transporter 2-like isoform X2 [Bacillus rossius redtenbacheri]|uniref:cationic amino acid transporter 2-like isoform X2 n=1 Tax=Bacillus rossius redtenbacheri TaxID=93214 RepID=UPI002FDDE259
MAACLQRLRRRKVFADEEGDGLGRTQLARVLTTTDLTALGVGSTLGVGVYVLAGSVSRSTAGPAVVLSFLVAAVASVFAGLCYAEFGARVPRAGSAYIYSYVCVGELVAFIIGWNLILEYVIGAASVGRGLSTYVDALLGDAMQNEFRRIAPIDVSFMSAYPDFFAFVVVNMFAADPENWRLRKEDIPPEAGEGGFFPYGFAGMVKGAATCFYGFVGFDCIATSGEETKNPQRAIPLSIVISLTIVFLAYFGISTVLTMMWPYYLQDPNAPIPYVFSQIDWPVAKWIVSVGAIFGLFASLLGALFPLPRVIYAMANDGLVFRFLGKVHPRFQTPLLGTVLAGLLTGTMAALFDLQHLVDMMSIGTLMAYSIVAACVMLLRYAEDGPAPRPGWRAADNKSRCALLSELTALVFNLRGFKEPNRTTSSLVAWEVLAYFAACVGVTAVAVHAEGGLGRGEPLPWFFVALFAGCLVVLVVSIALQPASRRKLSFKVPFVPFIPGLSILVNIYLMMTLDYQTWIRFLVWMAVGFAIYFGYGIWKSSGATPETAHVKKQKTKR